MLMIQLEKLNLRHIEELEKAWSQEDEEKSKK